MAFLSLLIASGSSSSSASEGPTKTRLNQLLEDLFDFPVALLEASREADSVVLVVLVDVADDEGSLEFRLEELRDFSSYAHAPPERRP